MPFFSIDGSLPAGDRSHVLVIIVEALQSGAGAVVDRPHELGKCNLSGGGLVEEQLVGAYAQLALPYGRAGIILVPYAGVKFSSS
jgi:hypothetical protein